MSPNGVSIASLDRTTASTSSNASAIESLIVSRNELVTTDVPVKNVTPRMIASAVAM